ncbi:MAG: DNA polymerase IV [Eubacteriales bacterium]|nr:DNA polymerase IV [Eubacteriales bacterium]
MSALSSEHFASRATDLGERSILHCDMNAFYASVEMILNPQLRGSRMAVAGSREDRHGIILAKSEAAKQAGVKTGEAIWQAQQKCPDLILVPPNYEAYLYYSRLARKIYYEYSDQVESYGLDECWLDVSESQKLFGSGAEIADQLRARMKSELKLSISVGVSFNKVFAKFGSDYKKPDASTVIGRHDFRRVIWPRPASELLGVGPATTRKLAKYGIFTIGDLARAPRDFLGQRLGVNGLRLHDWANGLDSGRVRIFGESIPVKSIGHGLTCRRDLQNAEEVFTVLLKLSHELSYRLQEGNYKAGGIQIGLKDTELHTVELQKPLPYPASSELYLARHAFALYLEKYPQNKPLRALSVRAIQLQAANQPIQEHFFEDWQKLEKLEKLNRISYSLSEKYGRNILCPARLLNCDYTAENPPLLIRPPGLPLDN